MADLKHTKAYANTQFEIKTDDGFRDFEGILTGVNTNKIRIQCSESLYLICTPKHKLKTIHGDIIYAQDLNVGDVMFNNIQVQSIEEFTSNDPVYEILHVHSDDHTYIVNGISSQQCLIIDEMAFIPTHIMEEFWKSVIPVISSTRTTKIFCVSTPNKTGNKFHEVYTNAERGDLVDWTYDRIDWWDIPGRGKKWKREMVGALGSEEAFSQEYGNEFLEVGESAIQGGVIKDLRQTCCEPEVLLEDGHYKIWEQPIEGHIYVAGVDVSEGVGEAASVAQILDITNLQDIRQVATYHDDVIDPFHFGAQLNKIGRHWGKPWMCIERNNCGGQVIDALYNAHNYTKIVEYSPQKAQKYTRLGIYSHTNSKYKGVVNMRYWLNSLRAVELKDVGLIQELETFVRHSNNTWKKKTGSYTRDDRVMALCWALFILEVEVASNYYDVISYDDQGRPKQIQSISVEAPEFYTLDEFYMDEAAPLPMHFGSTPMANDDSQLELIHQGWTPLHK